MAPTTQDLPPYTTVQRYFYAWRDSGVWQTINHVLLIEVREAAGREASPTAGVIVSGGENPRMDGASSLRVHVSRSLIPFLNGHRPPVTDCAWTASPL
jgi:transposase